MASTSDIFDPGGGVFLPPSQLFNGRTLGGERPKLFLDSFDRKQNYVDYFIAPLVAGGQARRFAPISLSCLTKTFFGLKTNRLVVLAPEYIPFYTTSPHGNVRRKISPTENLS